jgi:hypothetical protein
MIEKNIEEYSFVDCLLIDFGMNKSISTLFITFEAYFPLSIDGKRKKGLLKIIFDGINNVSVLKKEELEYDISLPYDKEGNDARANEIYSVKLSKFGNEYKKCIVHSDMLDLEIVFKEFVIEEIE